MVARASDDTVPPWAAWDILTDLAKSAPHPTPIPLELLRLTSKTEVGTVSVAPDGNEFLIPPAEELNSHYADVAVRASAHRSRGGKVVVVQGLGFVGSAVAAVIASARLADGSPRYFVIGTDLATPSAYWKVARISQGEVPIASPDAELSTLIADAVGRDRNLAAVVSEEAYGLADYIVVDLPLDVAERLETSAGAIDVRLAAFERALSSIGKHMRKDALVLIETTVPIGVTERVALPLLREILAKRGFEGEPLLAHAYERVMPGPRYVDSIKRFWRTYSGTDAASAEAARAFLSTFIEVDRYPLFELGDTNASELAKVLENSYRAVNIAFLYEWTLLAERIGVNLFEVVNSIRVRKGTHDNMRFPGFGVGGYCLTKDSLLAQWSATSLFETNVELAMTLEALRINHQMPLHALDLAKSLAGGKVGNGQLAVAGVSYLADVADTRNSPTEVVADALGRGAMKFVITDPYLAHWDERPSVPVERSFARAVADANGILFAVPHREYRELDAERILALAPHLEYVVDGFDVLTDSIAARLHDRGVRVAGVGKGHWHKRGYDL